MKYFCDLSLKSCIFIEVYGLCILGKKYYLLKNIKNWTFHLFAMHRLPLKKILLFAPC